MFEKGLGVAQDYAEAVRLYRLAADQGLASAQFNLGNCNRFKNVKNSFYGEVVAQDRAEAGPA